MMFEAMYQQIFWWDLYHLMASLQTFEMIRKW